MRKESGQIDLSVLQAGVSKTRISTHRLRQFLHSVLQQVEDSKAKEHIYSVAGDAIIGVPSLLDDIDRELNNLSYTLASMTRRDLKKQISSTDLQTLDQAIKNIPDVMSKQADLDPQLGWPGGRCQVVDRIEEEAPRRKDLMDRVELGEDLTNPQTSSVYSQRVEPGDGMFRHMILTAHAQYRMDLRAVTAVHIRALLRELAVVYSKAKSQGDDSIMKKIQSRDGYEYTSHHLGLSVVLRSEEPKVAIVVSCWWEGERDPGPRSCRLAFQHKQRGQEKLKAQRYYRQHKNQIKRRAVTRYRKIKNTSKVKRYRKMYQAYPQRYKRRIASEPLVFWWEPRQDYLVVSGIQDGRLFGTLGEQNASVSLQRFDAVAQPVTPGSVFGIVALLDREFGEPISKTSAKIAEIQTGLNPQVQAKAESLHPQLARVNPARNMWLFKVGKHQVRVKAEGTGKVSSRHLRVRCSCPGWQYNGAEYWASQDGYLLGKPVGTVTAPNIRDPEGHNRLCKHVAACLRVVRDY